MVYMAAQPTHGTEVFVGDEEEEAAAAEDRGIAPPHAADLDQLLGDRYPGERLAEDFRQRYRDAKTALRHKAHSDD